MSTPNDDNILNTLMRGLIVLEAFAETSDPLSAAAIAKITNLPRATVGRILNTLQSAGYVSSENKHYALTPKILLLSQAHLSSNSLPALVQPTLEHITNTLDEACSLTILSGTEVIYIARAARKSLSIMKDPVLIGTSLPAYCSSTGRILLSTLPLEKQETILKESVIKAHTKYTITEIDELLEIIRLSKKNGYAISNQEVELGICSIATIVKNSKGEVVGAINISTNTARTKPEEIVDNFLEHLLAASAYLEKIL